MGDLKGSYAYQYELIIYAVKGKVKLNGKRDSDILKFKKTGNNFHPTQKPVELLEYLIEKSSSNNGVVFDGFMGELFDRCSMYENKKKVHRD